METVKNKFLEMKLVCQKACPPSTHTQNKKSHIKAFAKSLFKKAVLPEVYKRSPFPTALPMLGITALFGVFFFFFNFLCLWTLTRKITSSPFDFILYSLNTQDKHFSHLLPTHRSSLINFLSICSTQFFFWSTNLHLDYLLSSLSPGSLALKYAVKIIF